MSGQQQDAAPAEMVWALDDPRSGASDQAIAIAERLGVGFRRIPLTWNWLSHVASLSPRGSLMGLEGATLSDLPLPWPLPGAGGPKLVLSAGSRSASVALWLKARFGAAVVHCMRPHFSVALRGPLFDLLVVPRHDDPPSLSNIFPVLGIPHRISPFALAQARSAWQERLGHLPRPRVALLVGGPPRLPELEPALAHNLGGQVARLALAHGGSVLAMAGRRTGAEATDALAAGLSHVMHVLYRWGEPGENPYLGFLALADVIVVAGDSELTTSEACATAAPVYVALPQLAGPRQRRFHANLFQAGQARPFADSIAPWRRDPLDEAERVASRARRFLSAD
jgi:mitochondrial fission protein ELM1